MNAPTKEIIDGRKEQTGYSETDQAILELVNMLIKRYGISVYELDCFDQHECDRCDH